jgi:Asp-tRNA(Asn)/Glu-tRNA(Gln) amidotransferase B subunit
VIEERGAKGPRQVAEDEGLQQVSDEGELQAIVEQVVADNADTVERSAAATTRPSARWSARS